MAIAVRVCATADLGSRSISILRGRAATVPSFRRGDADGDGHVTLTDAVVVLDTLFRGKGPLPCADAADADDDGIVNLTDGVRILLYLFQGGPAPPAPGPEVCGGDPTADKLAPCVEGCP